MAEKTDVKKDELKMQPEQSDASEQKAPEGVTAGIPSPEETAPEAQVKIPAPPVAPPVRKQFLIESDGVLVHGTNINNAFSMVELQQALEEMLQQIRQIRQNALQAARAPVKEPPPEEDQDV